MDLGLKGKVAIVTGSSRGVGRAIAAALLREGARVMISGRDPQRLEATRAALEQESGGEVRAAVADLRHDADAKSLIDATLKTFGHLDILVNNAASVMPADFMKLTEEIWAEVFEQKLNGYVRCLRHAIPAMKGRGWGRIINISGVGARQPGSKVVPVGINNAAVLNLTKSLAWALASENILVNAVVPYIINTDIQDETMRRWAVLAGKTEAEIRKERVALLPLQRMGRPEEVADVVTFLASERTSFVTGAAWHVDGGGCHSI